MNRSLFVLSPILMAATCGVAPAEWQSTGRIDRPFEIVWSTCLDVVAKQGFTIKTAEKADRRIETEWKVQLAPHWREGRREMIEVEILERKTGGAFVVRVRCPLERNDNSKSPMSIEDADWIAGGGSDEVALRVTSLLKMKLRGLRLDD